MSEQQVMVLGKVKKGISKTSSVQGYESAWLDRWTQLGNEVKYNGESKELIKPEDNVKERKFGDEGVKVLPFPMFKVSQKRDSTTKLQAYPVFETKQYWKDEVGSSSKSMANRMPWMYAQGDNRLDFPIQEKTTQNLLALIKPARTYETVDLVQRVSGEINLPEEDGHRLMKVSTASMKLKGKIIDGNLDLFPNLDQVFPNLDQCRKGGVRLQPLESSKDTKEDGPRKDVSSAETDTLEMDRFQTMNLFGAICSSSIKGKGRKSDSAIPRIELPDMNEVPPLVPDREDSVERHPGETSNSVTQSMNVDHFLFRESKRARLDLETEPSCRWVKRLKKKNSSDSSRHDETKSMMKIEEAPPSQKGNNNNLFLEILKSGINNLQPKNQEPVASKIKNLNQGGEDITLLHPWIQRWCKTKATSTDQPGGQEVSFEPENQKEIEKKQYPSIAAMALMGKALNGLNPYGLRKTDSLMVWNARDLR